MDQQETALCDIRGPLNDLFDKLSGKEREAWLRGFKKFLRRENPWPQEGGDPLHAGLVVTIGERIRAQYRHELETAGIRITVLASKMLDVMPVARRRKRVRLMGIRLRDIGITEPTRQELVLQRAAARSIKRCAAEAVVALCLAWRDPLKRRLLAAVTPVVVDGRKCVFGLEDNHGVLWLTGSLLNEEYQYPYDTELIFDSSDP